MGRQVVPALAVRGLCARSPLNLLYNCLAFSSLLSLLLFTTMSDSGPSYAHEDLTNFFSTFFIDLLTNAAKLDAPQRVLLRPEPQRGLPGSKRSVPDGIITMRRMGQNYHFMWIEVCRTETANHVFNKVSHLTLLDCDLMVFVSWLGCCRTG